MQYLGLMDCQYYQGKIGEIDHKCCGGKISKWARIQCKKRGVVTAQDICTQKCEYGPKHRTFNMGPKKSEGRDLNQKGDVMKLISEPAPIKIVDEAVNTNDISDSLKASVDSNGNSGGSADEMIGNVSNVTSPQNSGSQTPAGRPKTIWQVWTEEILAGNAKH